MKTCTVDKTWTNQHKMREEVVWVREDARKFIGSLHPTIRKLVIENIYALADIACETFGEVFVGLSNATTEKVELSIGSQNEQVKNYNMTIEFYPTDRGWISPQFDMPDEFVHQSTTGMKIAI